MNFIHTLEQYSAPAGRVIIGAFFFMAGLNKVFDNAGTAGYIESVGLPMGSLLAWLAAIFLIVVAGALIAGYHARHAARLLVLFTLFVTFVFHGPGMWENNSMEMLMFMKNWAIIGGLLFISAHAGKPPHASSLAGQNGPMPTL